MAALERWIHADDPLPPLVRAGLAHVLFETVHPFLDGNGRVGRLLITLLIEQCRLLPSPLLYLSLAIKRPAAGILRLALGRTQRRRLGRLAGVLPGVRARGGRRRRVGRTAPVHAARQAPP